MIELPQPFTPADCDLRGLPFMPLKIIQVMQSETFGLSTGDEFKAAFALWCASWMEVPAASLPADDRMLDFLSRSKTWKKVKDVALRGWILCADGRLYHPVVADNALEAWDKRTDYRDKEDSKNERQQRWRDQCKQLGAQLRERGITPPKGASLEKLRSLLGEAGVDGQASTNVDGEASTVDAGEIGKTETVKRQRQLTSKEVNDDATDSTRGDDDRLPPRPQLATAAAPTDRATEIAKQLRAAGVAKVTAFHPDVAVTWAQDERVTDQLLASAVDLAKESKGDAPIPIGYLKPIIDELLNPPEAKPAKPKTDDWAWKKSDQGIVNKGREMGMFARGGESYRDFASRIDDEIRKRKGGKA